MLVANFQNISSKKLGFVCSVVVFKHSKSISITIWSATGVFGSVSFSALSAAFGFCQFLGVKKSKINKINQLSFF